MADKDIISKSLLKRLLLDMARYLCNMELRDAKLLTTEHQRIEDRRADLIAKVQPAHGNPFILHLECPKQQRQPVIRISCLCSHLFEEVVFGGILRDA